MTPLIRKDIVLFRSFLQYTYFVFEGLFVLIRHPETALNITECIASETSEIQGQRYLCIVIGPEFPAYSVENNRLKKLIYAC